jgi:hypothetical protein
MSGAGSKRAPKPRTERTTSGCWFFAGSICNKLYRPLGKAGKMDAILSRTNFVTWSHVANSRPKQSWLDRAQMASHFIRPGETVADLGAGAQTLRTRCRCVPLLYGTASESQHDL